MTDKRVMIVRVEGEDAGWYGDAASVQLIEAFKQSHVEGPVLMMHWSPDENGVLFLTNASPQDALGMAAQFINGVVHDAIEIDPDDQG